MKIFVNKNFTAKEMKDIIRCKNYLQTFCLSDIEDIAVNHIETWAIKGRRDAMRRSKWEWLIQKRPTEVAWKIFNQAIRESFLDEEDITQQSGEWYDEDGDTQT
jgi:hypothetical protein